MSRSIRLALGTAGIALLVGAALSTASAQTVYKWKDAKGVTHYTDTPPPTSEPRGEVRKSAIPDSPAPQAAAKAKEESGAPVVAKTNAELRTASCKRAQDNLAVLQSATNTQISLDEDGDGKAEKVLSADQRNAQVTAMQAAVTLNCSPAI
jgi:hypothetical protein